MVMPAVGHKQAGFTLIELLVTFTILSLLMLTISSSFSFYSRYWNDKFHRFDETQQQARMLLQVSDVVQGAIPFVVQDSEGKLATYFLGRAEGFTLVSNQSLFADPGVLTVIRLFREPDPATGLWMLVYEEAHLPGIALRNLGQTLDFKHKLILQRDYQNIQFRYFGRKVDFESEFEQYGPMQWRDAHDAQYMRSQPGQIQVLLDQEQLFFAIPTGFKRMFNIYHGADA